MDVRLDAANRPWVLELNATPGLTETSLAPAAARHAGLEMPDVCTACSAAGSSEGTDHESQEKRIDCP